MQAVHKFNIIPGGYNAIDIQAGAVLLHAEVQHSNLALWALVDKTKPVVRRVVYVAMTGEELPERVLPAVWVATALLANGAFVVHVFDLGEVAGE